MNKLFQATIEGDALYIASSLFICIIEKRLRDDYKNQWEAQKDYLLAQRGVYSLTSMDTTGLNAMLIEDIGFGNEWYYCDQARLFRNEIAHIKNDAKMDVSKMEATWKKMCGFLENLKAKKEAYSYSQDLEERINKFISGIPSVVDENDPTYLYHEAQKAIREKDVQTANALLTKLVNEHNYASAMMDYSFLYRTGFFTNGKPDFDQSIYWAERALSTASKSNVDSIIERINFARQVYENAKSGDEDDILSVVKLHIDGIWLPRNWDTIIAHYDNLQSKGVLKTEEELWRLVENGVREVACVVSKRHMEQYGLTKAAHDRMDQILCKFSEFQADFLLMELESCVPNDAAILLAKMLLRRDPKSEEALSILKGYVREVMETPFNGPRNDFRFVYVCKTLIALSEKNIDKMQYIYSWVRYNADEESKKLYEHNMKQVVEWILSSRKIEALENYEIVYLYCRDNTDFQSVTRHFWTLYKEYVRGLYEGKEIVGRFFGKEELWPYSGYFKVVGRNSDSEIEQLIEEKKTAFARIYRDKYKQRCDQEISQIKVLIDCMPDLTIPQNLKDVKEKGNQLYRFCESAEETKKVAESILGEKYVFETADLKLPLEAEIGHLRSVLLKCWDVLVAADKKKKELEAAEEKKKARKRILKGLAGIGTVAAIGLAATFGIHTVAMSSMKSGNYIDAYKILDKLAILPIYEESRVECLSEIRKAMVEKGFRSEYFSADGTLVDLTEEFIPKEEESSVQVNSDGTITVLDGSVDPASYSDWTNIVKAVCPDTGMVIALDANGNIHKAASSIWNWSDTKYAMEMYTNIPERAADLLVVEAEFDTSCFVELEDGSYYQLLVDFNQYGLSPHAIPTAEVISIHVTEDAMYYVMNNGDCVNFATGETFRCEGTIDKIYDSYIMKGTDGTLYYNSHEEDGVLIMEAISPAGLPAEPKIVEYQDSKLVAIVDDACYMWNWRDGWVFLFDQVSNLAIADYRLIAVLSDGRLFPMYGMEEMEIEGKAIWEPHVCVDGTAYHEEDNWYDGNDFLFDDWDVYQPIDVYDSEVRKILGE